ncbi:NH(3)-dependent NAD(+) synthetase [Pedobacter psychrotolerans]|uniref:Glutamine-dependent NAD(+) synthetase n=1 Tax=Pedobacter psychrotolerans TaxID=1843235 RepID=A0A4R2H9J0_9SPHI|nr:NAD+ synthase [Pedobacter psychrotolerans]TCO23740.1 NH(3)-dependent NAD(+) synthetase [Pedobacter psychrotolerans]GGE62250.1 NAD+ synthase [Pedobacter psychrotolerans]
MKIALAQLNYHIGNFEANTQKIIDHIKLAEDKGADLVVFAELAICGYPPRDFLEFEEFISFCEAAALEIATHCTKIACIVGLPVKNQVLQGKDLYNAAYFIENGEIKAIAKKALLPTYDIFDEYRYFEPSRTFSCIEFKGKKIALTICEDLWNINDNPLYVSNPMDELIKEEPDVMINIAASPFSYTHDDERIKVLSDNAKKYHLPVFYVNQVGAQTEIIFDGGSLVFDADGAMKAEMKYFEEDLQVFDLEEIENVRNKYPQPERLTDIEQIHDALVLGIQDYFKKSGFTKAVLGLSGGIDSAVVCALACRALGAENVMAVLMPSKFSSDHSVQDAIDLVNNFGCMHEIIPIAAVASAFDSVLAQAFNGLPFNLTEENIQARTRGTIVMAMSNKFGYILLNTSNKSECAVGYGTLYGDMCGAIGVIGDVYKTQVFELAKYINNERELIPVNTIVKPPSAELRPDQKDSDSLPEYDVLDKILYHHIEEKQGSKSIIAKGFDEALVQRILKMVNIAEFKRYQTPPILRVSPKAFGMGRRMPIVGKYMA